MLELWLFYSENCNVCKVIEPKLSKLAKEFNIPFKKINLSKNPTESGKFLVFSVPTVLLTEEGQEIKRWGGVFSLEEIASYLYRTVNKRS